MEQAILAVAHLQSNTKELVKAWKASHDSVFKWHWKKMHPFSWVFPQVDYLRIQKVMDECRVHISQQIPQATQLMNQANSPELRQYYVATLDYLSELDKACSGISIVSALKHGKLAGQKSTWKEANSKLQSYQTVLSQLFQKSDVARTAFHNLDPEIRKQK